MNPRARVPLTPIAPPCAWYGSRQPDSRCKAKARCWLVAPDGSHAPGGYYCDEHATEIVTEYREKLGETWTTVPLVYRCEHSRDPRLCWECRPHALEADTPAERGDYECRRCGEVATYCASAEEANEKLGPCCPHKFGLSTPPAPDEVHRPAGAGDYGCVRCGSWTTYCLGSMQANAKMGPCPDAPFPEGRP